MAKKMSEGTKWGLVLAGCIAGFMFLNAGNFVNVLFIILGIYSFYKLTGWLFIPI